MGVWVCRVGYAAELALLMDQAGACSTLCHRWMPIRGGDSAFSHFRFPTCRSILLTSEKFNEGRKPTSLIRFMEPSKRGLPVAKCSSHGSLANTLWLPNLDDELGSHTV